MVDFASRAGEDVEMEYREKNVQVFSRSKDRCRNCVRVEPVLDSAGKRGFGFRDLWTVCSWGRVSRVLRMVDGLWGRCSAGCTVYGTCCVLRFRLRRLGEFGVKLDCLWEEYER